MWLAVTCQTPAPHASWDTALKWLGRSWAVIVGLLRVSVTFVVLGAFQSPFERTAVALLVIIYASVDSVGMWNTMMRIEQSKLERNRFLELMEQLGSNRYKTEDSKEMMKDENEKIERAVVKVFIRGAFTSIIYAAAILATLMELCPARSRAVSGQR